MCGNGEESGSSEREADKGPLAPTSAEAVSSFEDVRYFCFYKINIWSERAAGHLSHTTNKADVTSQLLQKVTFQVHMHAVHMYLYFTL